MKVISQQQLIKNIGFFLDKATLQLGQEIVQQLRTKLELDSNHFLEDINHGNSCVWTKDAIETGPDLWRPIALGRHCNTITGREFREILLLSDDLSKILTSQSGFVQWRQNMLPSCTNIILNLRFRNSRSHYNTLSRWNSVAICQEIARSSVFIIFESSHSSLIIKHLVFSSVNVQL